MLLVDNILFSPFRGILWIFREIRDIAQEELDGEAKSVTERLQTLYMQLETGRITEAEFEAGERLLLDRLEAIESRRSDESEMKEAGEDEESGEDDEEESNENEESGENEAEESDEDETEKSGEAGQELDEM